MVREVIHVQVGQCGNQIGNRFWNTLRQEHGLNGKGFWEKNCQDSKEDKDEKTALREKDKIDVYFAEGQNSRFVPRACVVDLEPGAVDSIKNSSVGKMYRPDNFVFGASGAGNNWAKGHYTEGAELAEEVLDTVRKEVERADAASGFQLCHSLGGGTGSGMGTLLLLKMRDTYPDRITATFSVFPSPRVSDVVVEPYNATLAIHQLLENADETFIIDNEALFFITKRIGVSNGFSGMNDIIAQVMSGVSASLRFPGKLNSDLRKLSVNLVPFPRLHFFLMSQAPLLSSLNMSHTKLTVRELTDEMWHAHQFLANVKPEDGKYLTASCTYRGNMSTQEIDEELNRIQDKESDSFVEWIPNNIKSSIVSVPPKSVSKSATFVANTTATKGVFQRIATQFAKLYKRKAFLHWYKEEGMDDMEFQEADKNQRDLITEYQDKQDAVVDLNQDDDDEYDDSDENI